MIIPSNNLLGFPLDSSQIGYHDDGLPAYSQEYTSSDYRIVLDKLISTGVIADEDSQSLKPSIASGQTSKTAKVRIKAGASMIDGGFAINKSYTDINIVAPEIQGSETSRTKTTYIYIQRFGVGGDGGIVAESYDFVSEESTSSGNSILETPPSKSHAICLARVVSRTTKSGTSYLYQHTVTDLRASEYCGWAAPFVDVDTSAYYDAVQQVVEESKAEVEATIPILLENAQDSVDSAIAELEEQTQTAVDLAQSAIDGTVAGELDSKIESLTDGLDSRLDGIEDGVPAMLAITKEIKPTVNTNLYAYINTGSYFCRKDNVSLMKSMPELPEDTQNEGFKMFVVEMDTHDDYTKVSLQLMIYGVHIATRIVRKKDNISYPGDWKWLDIKISTSSIQDSAITTQKLADGSVTEDKLAQELQDSMFPYVSTSSSGIDLNTLTSNGIFSCAPNSQNSPLSSEWVNVVVVRKNDNPSYVTQIATTGAFVWMRNRTGSVWDEWKNISSAGKNQKEFSCAKGGSLLCIKKGNVIQYNSQGITKSTTDSEVLCTIDELYRPIATVSLVSVNGNGQTMKINVLADGQVKGSGTVSGSIWDSNCGVAAN